MFTKEDLITQLKSLGVPTDKPIIVHTSLKKIGQTEGRAEGLLDTLIEYKQDGVKHSFLERFDKEDI